MFSLQNVQCMYQKNKILCVMKPGSISCLFISSTENLNLRGGSRNLSWRRSYKRPSQIKRHVTHQHKLYTTTITNTHTHTHTHTHTRTLARTQTHTVQLRYNEARNTSNRKTRQVYTSQDKARHKTWRDLTDTTHLVQHITTHICTPQRTFCTYQPGVLPSIELTPEHFVHPLIGYFFSSS